MKKQALLPTLSFILLVPIAIAAITEVFKSVLIWHFRVVDFFDLVLTAPLYFICFVLIYFRLEQNEVTPRMKWAYIIFVVLFLYGHAMHVTANSVDTYSMEIRGYQAQIPQDVYELIYFLDETLSHIIMFIGLYGFLLCLLWINGTALEDGDKINSWALVLGIVSGVGQSIALIEAGKVWLAGILWLSTTIIFILLNIRTHLGLGQLLKKSVMTTFFLGIVPAQVFCLLTYWLIVGDFIQPSKMGL